MILARKLPSHLLHLHEVHELSRPGVARHAVDAALAAHVGQNLACNAHLLLRGQRLLEQRASQLVEHRRHVTARAAVSAPKRHSLAHTEEQLRRMGLYVVVLLQVLPFEEGGRSS